MRAITTRYLGATDTKSSRIKAHDNGATFAGERSRSITIGYPHEARMGADAHARAALALCRKLGWTRENFGGQYGPTHLIAGGTVDGYVFTFVRLTGDDVDQLDAYALPSLEDGVAAAVAGTYVEEAL